jgi:hypothetical protein
MSSGKPKKDKLKIKTDKTAKTIEKKLEKQLNNDHYVDNKEFLAEMIKWKKEIREAEDTDDERPPISNYIGECFLKIAERLCSKSNFANYPYKDEPIYDLYVNNTLETLENKQNFSACLFGYIKCKEYNITFEKMEETEENTSIIQQMKCLRKEREQNEKDIISNGILHAQDITKEEYIQKIKQRDDYLTDDDIYQIYRYNIKSCYGITNEHLNDDFINEYYDTNKMRWYKNYTTILPNNEQSVEQKLTILQENHKNYKWINNCYVDFTTKNHYTYHYYAQMIIQILKFDVLNLGNEINNDEFINDLDLCMKWIFEKKNEIAKKYEMSKIIAIPEKISNKLKIINTILFSMYGMKVVHNKNKTTYKLCNNKVWNNLQKDVESKTLELKSNLEDVFDDIDDIDTSEIDVII